MQIAHSKMNKLNSKMLEIEDREVIKNKNKNLLKNIMNKKIIKKNYKELHQEKEIS